MTPDEKPCTSCGIGIVKWIYRMEAGDYVFLCIPCHDEFVRVG